MKWELRVAQYDGQWVAFARDVPNPLGSVWMSGRRTREDAVDDLETLADMLGPENVTYAEAVNSDAQ